MNAAAAILFAEGFVRGFCDVIGAMLSSKPSFRANPPESATLGAVQDALSETPLAIECAVVGGGAIVVLIAVEDARRMVSAVMGEEPRKGAGLPDDEAGAMKEIFDPCMGGGAGHFKEKYGAAIELDPAEVRLAAAEQAAAILQVLGSGATVTRFSYDVPETVEGGAAAVLFSQTLERAIPPQALGADGAEREVLGIVQERFGMPDAAEGVSSGASRDLPGNLNMILDIALTVTVRLGRIEMPLGRVLELGPGSIIQVGHSVDEPVELLVNNKLIARGDVVVVEEKFGLRITEIVSPTERIESLR
ncbi:MAG TPA: flagellar motor switch protein FliN [Candidatus Hydrogenedentes bacterium]|nr:flagellar motor switch protein FliN [Candidatus Hydrogenedentota bacterium]HQH51041.1 flagellar motor switch protein FliN [Candidatus Hydrogenedentota bacterium]HQM48763.1 flagellar motor switch protein FliN [Candidatus Hydrogenedentota bacterium]